MTETVAAALRHAAARLRDADVPSPERDARALIAFAIDLAPERLMLEPDRPLTVPEAARLAAAVADRAARRPVAQITGSRLFWGRPFRVTGDVLDPRPETETLIAVALEGPAPRRLLDLGTGSGILAITLLAEWAAAEAVATDISPDALNVARTNVADLGVADRVRFLKSDWFSAVEGRFDLIVSNPPYIAAEEMPTLDPDVRKWEPHLALTPGGDGLDAYRRIAESLRHHLQPGGRCLFEIGRTQGEDVVAILLEAGLEQVRIHPDLNGAERVVEAFSGG